MDYDRCWRCRCCGATDLLLALDLGQQPLANSYLREPLDLPVFPLELMVCNQCFHSQLSIVVNPDLMFRHYLYVSGTSRTFREHFTAFARETLTWVEPRPERVLDIACNDGTLLEAFRHQGCSVQGVEPAANLLELARSKRLAVTEGYWPDVRPEIDGSFDLVTATNVLAHVPDPAAFLEAALDCLHEGGAVLVEFPYCRELIDRCAWDTVYHEHLSYFLAAPMLRLADRLGASITHAQRVPSHGGSLRLALQRGRDCHCSEILALAEAERRDGFQDLRTYQRFAIQVEESCRELRRLVSSQVAQGRRLVGYGASAKGNTLLNHCPLPLAYITDDNPLKHGYLTPGRNIPIRPSAALASEPADLCVVLLAWNLADEIRGNVRRLRPTRKDTALFYVPAVRCEPI